MPKTDAERQEFLKGLGLNPDAPALTSLSEPEPERPKKPKAQLAPKGADPHAMPVSEIVFDPALLDQFPNLEGQGRRAAADYVFALYKSPGRNKDRNSLLWSEVGKFIQRVHRSRETGVPHVKDKVKAGKKSRDLLAVLAELGIESVDDLTALLAKEEK